MFFSGWILLVALVDEDLSKSEWWHGLSYIPNIAAGLTGFLIGAPVALVLLASFTIEREERTALERVNRLTLLAWNEFCEAVHNLCSNSRMLGLSIHANQVNDYYTAAVTVFSAYRGSGHAETDFHKLRSFFDEQLPKWQQSLSVVSAGIGSQDNVQLLWSAVLTDWSTLDQYVRLQRLERSLPWFDSDIHADIRDRLSGTSNPLVRFSAIHDEGVGTAYGNVSQSYKLVHDWIRLDKDQFDQRFLHAGSTAIGFPWQASADYLKEANGAYAMLRGLEQSVIAVRQANWPDCATKPTEPF